MSAETIELAANTCVTVRARYDADKETRTFELVEQIYPPDGEPVSREPYSGVYVWKCVEIIRVGETRGRSPQQYVVKFYDPDRATQLDVPEEEKADFYFNTEDYMDRQIRGLSPALAEIVGVGLARLAPGTPAGDYDTEEGIGVRRFAVITTPNDSTDFLAVKNNLVVTKEDLGEVPLGMQYLLRVAMSQLCEALDTMHVAGVYHQDIKTENMVLGASEGWSFEQSVDAWNQLVAPKYRLGIMGFRSDDTPWSRDIDTQVLNVAGSIALEMLKIVAGVVPDGTTLTEANLTSTPKRRDRDSDEDDPEPKRARGLSARVGQEASAEELRDDLTLTQGEELRVVLGSLVPWAMTVQGGLRAMLIDFDRGRSMNAIADMTTIGVDGTISTLDPWRVVTDGNPDLYDFAPSTPQQQLRAALHGSDLWSMGITMYEMANLSNPFDAKKANEVLAAFADARGLLTDQELAAITTSVVENSAQGFTMEAYKDMCAVFTRKGRGSLRPSALIDETMGWEVIRPLLSFRLSDRYGVPMRDIVKGLKMAPTA